MELFNEKTCQKYFPKFNHDKSNVDSLFRVFSVVVLYRCWKLRSDTVDVGLPRSNPTSQPPSVITGVHKHYNPEQSIHLKKFAFKVSNSTGIFRLLTKLGSF